jgi:3-deoxy-D-manno-octulosonate 8-phosphate phosphatase (KDO 8-P phosphatase)
MTIAAELWRRLAAVRLLSLDLDGVLTDGGLYYTDEGTELRKYDVKDGMGIKLVQRAGLAVSLITQSTAPAIAHRAVRLGIEQAHLGIEEKLPMLRKICDGLGFGLDAVLHIADDVNDLPVLRAVGLPVAVADAVAEVKAVADLTTSRPGGHGAVREICDLLLRARAMVDEQKLQQRSAQQ